MESKEEGSLGKRQAMTDSCPIDELITLKVKVARSKRCVTREVFGVLQDKMREFESKLDSVSDKITMCTNSEWLKFDNPLIDENMLLESTIQSAEVDPAGRIKVYSPEVIAAAEEAAKEAKSLITVEARLDLSDFDCYEPLKMLFLGISLLKKTMMY